MLDNLAGIQDKVQDGFCVIKSAHPHSLIGHSFPPEGTFNPWISIESTLKTLIRLDGCTD